MQDTNGKPKLRTGQEEMVVAYVPGSEDRRGLIS